MKHIGKPRPSLDKLYEGIIHGDRVMLGQGITIVESTLESDVELASRLVERILPHSGKSWRIGITGIPGVGKSTFIETIGTYVLKDGHKLAVLSIDPSSPVSRGSILGDKTRMENLSKHPMAFVRPTAASDHIGGVGRNTRESMLLCEAAGFDIVFVETVGVGQSELDVHDMVDFFILLMIAGAGDELQGMKKGIMELADALIVTKADGQNISAANQSATMYRQALHLFQRSKNEWEPFVLTSSSITGEGFTTIWNETCRFFADDKSSGRISDVRSRQQVAWFRQLFIEMMNQDINRTDDLIALQTKLNKQVADSELPPAQAAAQLLDAYHRAIRRGG